MTEIKKNESFIPTKNYVIAFFIIIGVILLSWYAFAWYKTIKTNKVAESYLVTEKVVSNEIKSLDELSDILSESPETYYIFISYTGSEDVYNLEKEMAKLISEYNLSDSFYYLNITNIMNDEDYLDKINETLNLKDEKVKQVPTVLYYQDGALVNIINKDDKSMMNIGDFQKMLDVNQIEKDQ